MYIILFPVHHRVKNLLHYLSNETVTVKCVPHLGRCSDSESLSVSRAMEISRSLFDSLVILSCGEECLCFPTDRASHSNIIYLVVEFMLVIKQGEQQAPISFGACSFTWDSDLEINGSN